LGASSSAAPPFAVVAPLLLAFLAGCDLCGFHASRSDFYGDASGSEWFGLESVLI